MASVRARGTAFGRAPSAARLRVSMDERLVGYLQRQSEHGPDSFREFRQTVQLLSRKLGSRGGATVDPAEIRARTLLSECLDYLGEYERAAAVLAPYDDVAFLNRLRVRDVKRFARVALHLSHAAYRQFALAQSKMLVDRSLEAYENCGDFFGQALALFHAAKIVYRQTNGEQARSHLDASIQILAGKIPSRGDYRKALSKILLGWFACRDGRMSEAGSNVAEALTTLEKTDDLVNLARIHDIRGQICRSGPPEEWPRAVTAFTTAARLYERAGHSTYRARALNYAGQTYERMRRFTRAGRTLQRAARTRSQDPRTAVENKCFRARVFLASGEWRKAETAVNEALREASRREFRRLHAEALITKARLRLERPSEGGDADSAEHLLLQAEIVNGGADRVVSQKIEAATNLLLARFYCRQSPPDAVLAESRLNRARLALRTVQDHFLHTIEAAVAAEIRTVDDSFNISRTPHMPLEYSQYQELLRFWLVRQAVRRVRDEANVLPHTQRRRQGVDREKVARELGMTRQNLELWLEGWRDGKRRLVNVSPRALRAVLAAFNLRPARNPQS